MSTLLFLVWLLSIAGAAICAKMNRLPVLWWSVGALFTGPLVFVGLGLWLDRMNDKS